MANRSNRRRQNPRMSRCEKHEKAIGSWRANSPSWPGIASRSHTQRPDIRAQSNLPAKERSACNRGGVHIRTSTCGGGRGYHPPAGNPAFSVARGRIGQNRTLVARQLGPGVEGTTEAPQVFHILSSQLQNTGWTVRLCPVWAIDRSRAGGSQHLRPVVNV